MTNKELKKLRRRDLLELLVQQTEDNERLQAQVDALTAQLESKAQDIGKAASYAKEFMSVNDMFRTADAVAKQYLDNARRMAQQQEELCAGMMRECRERCDAMIAETERACEAKKQEAEAFRQERITGSGKSLDERDGQSVPPAVRGEIFGKNNESAETGVITAQAGAEPGK